MITFLLGPVSGYILPVILSSGSSGAPLACPSSISPHLPFVPPLSSTYIYTYIHTYIYIYIYIHIHIYIYIYIYVWTTVPGGTAIILWQSLAEGDPMAQMECQGRPETRRRLARERKRRFSSSSEYGSRKNSR